MKRLFAGTLTAMLALSLTACGQQEQGDAKPVIYLYPEQETTVSVSLDYAGTLTATYPAYENGWHVIAEPDGTLYDENGDEYSYLFWEGENNTDYDFSTGFCVAGADTADFLREKLAEIGLTPRDSSSRSMDSGSRSAATRPPSAAFDKSSSILVTISSASDLVEPIRPTGPRFAQPVAYRRSRTSSVASAAVVIRPSPFAFAKCA